MSGSNWSRILKMIVCSGSDNNSLKENCSSDIIRDDDNENKMKIIWSERDNGDNNNDKCSNIEC